MRRLAVTCLQSIPARAGEGLGLGVGQWARLAHGRRLSTQSGLRGAQVGRCGVSGNHAAGESPLSSLAGQPSNYEGAWASAQRDQARGPSKLCLGCRLREPRPHGSSGSWLAAPRLPAPARVDHVHGPRGEPPARRIHYSITAAHLVANLGRSNCVPHHVLPILFSPLVRGIRCRAN
jgi:hypothetical protein